MANRNRAVHVATVSQDGIPNRGSAEHLERMLERLDWASCRQPDIVCLPENFPVYDRNTAPTVPSPLTDRLCQWARQKRCYLIAPMRLRAGSGHYNSALVIDRQGAIMGRYDKAHPVDVEIDPGGIQPGDLDIPVFQTDFGAIGIQICFDVNWRDGWKLLKEKGAEIVFFPAAYPAARHLAVHARVHEYYVVSSTVSRPSSIFDITGEVIASSGMFQQWADATIHLSKRLFEIDRHMKATREVERKYGRRVLVRWYHDEDQFTLASLDSDLAVEDVIQEFGLLPLSDYMAESQAVQDAARSR